MPISKVISKARPDHPSLDYDVLRAEGIRHLENFATEIWTDYNAHDPGITMLEVLCYAITDLGYRTRMLPVSDLMADPSKDFKPWFLAAEVLPCSPVTGLDYRKLLIDVKGVKNAWIAEGNSEIDLVSLGVILPRLSDEYFVLDQAAINKFYQENWKSIFPDKAKADEPAPAIDITTLIGLISKKQDEIKSLPQILPYLNAIGDNLDALAILEIKKQLINVPPGTDFNRIYGYIKARPDQENLPYPPSGIIGIVNDSLLPAGNENYDTLLENSISHFIVSYVPVEVDDELNDTDKGSLVNYLSEGDEDVALTENAQTALDSIPGDYLLEKQRSLIKAYIDSIRDPDISDANLTSVLNYYQIDLPYNIYFLNDFNEKFYIPESGNPDSERRWRVEQVAITNFLSNAFNKVDDDQLVGQVVNYYENKSEDSGGSDAPTDAEKVVNYIFSEKFCEYGRWGLRVRPESETVLETDLIPLSGLYTIILDLDESIDTGIPNRVNRIIDSVKKVLHANRGLCEDYVSIKVVEERPIGICLNLDIDPEADELEIFAEAIRRMQEYLSPVPRFRTFAMRLAELHAQGKNDSAEQIFNGPLLLNGFLDDAELGETLPQEVYYHSDLLREIMSIKGIKGIPVLKVNAEPETTTSSFVESTKYEVYSGDFKNPADPNSPDAPYCKPVIKLKQSFFTVKKGARSFEMDVANIEERLELLRLIHSSDPLEPPGGPVWEEGRYRPDLADYRSLQYDLPYTYTVGDNRPSDDAPLRRKAQAKHLQAYLAFYDQILASYLAQLGRVRRLLSVDQTADGPTRVLPLLYDMPGLRDLVGLDAPFKAEPVDWSMLISGIRDNLQSISEGQGNTDKLNDRALAELLLHDLRNKTQYTGLFDLRNELYKAFAPYPKFHELYAKYIEDYFWAKYTADPGNKYAQMVLDLAESTADQARRKNQLLDHLIARFGEEFSAYAVALLRPEAEPEDNPRQQTFEEYLGAKAGFLGEIANLAYERNRGYNYRLFDALQNVSDVWNTFNVSGLQKRVCRKLGIPTWETRSLIAEPNYTIDILKGNNKRGMANFRAALRRRLEVQKDPVSADEAVPLLISPPYNSPRVAQEKINELYKFIWQAEYYAPDKNVPETTYYWFTTKNMPGGKKIAILVKRKDSATPKSEFVQQGTEKIFVDILLQSELRSLDEAIDRINHDVIPLVVPNNPGKEKEGFHIVEHILLRPLEPDDKVLQISLGCEPEEIPRDPYSFWITVVAPAETTRFSDRDFRTFFEHEFRSEMPAHIAARFCYLDLDDMYKFEEVFGIWMFEKAKCSPPNYCRVDEAAFNLVTLLNGMSCSCACAEETPEHPCSTKTT